MALVLPLRCFFFLLPNYTNILVCFFLFVIFGDEPEVFLPRYSQTAILHAAHFQRVVKYYMLLLGFVNNTVSMLSLKERSQQVYISVATCAVLPRLFPLQILGFYL